MYFEGGDSSPPLLHLLHHHDVFFFFLNIHFFYCTLWCVPLAVEMLSHYELACSCDNPNASHLNWMQWSRLWVCPCIACCWWTIAAQCIGREAVSESCLPCCCLPPEISSSFRSNVSASTSHTFPVECLSAQCHSPQLSCFFFLLRLPSVIVLNWI